MYQALLAWFLYNKWHEKTPYFNLESQFIAELQAMVKALLTSQDQEASQWPQERKP